jgi:hypothetical protein
MKPVCPPFAVTRNSTAADARALARSNASGGRNGSSTALRQSVGVVIAPRKWIEPIAGKPDGVLFLRRFRCRVVHLAKRLGAHQHRDRSSGISGNCATSHSFCFNVARKRFT